MADPKKETKRERREVARQRRIEELRKRERKARMRKTITYVVIGVLVVAGIAGIFAARAASNKNKDKLRKAAAAGGCEPVRTFPNEVRGSNPHLAPYEYKTNPPTSGNHDPSTSPTGFPGQVPDANLVHNLEHGEIIFWYKPDLDTAVITGLQNLVKKEPQYYIMVPRTNMDAPLYFTSWTKSQRCPVPTTKTVAAAEFFAVSNKGKAPEGLRPGTPAGV